MTGEVLETPKGSWTEVRARLHLRVDRGASGRGDEGPGQLQPERRERDDAASRSRAAAGPRSRARRVRDRLSRGARERHGDTRRDGGDRRSRGRVAAVRDSATGNQGATRVERVAVDAGTSIPVRVETLADGKLVDGATISVAETLDRASVSFARPRVVPPGQEPVVNRVVGQSEVSLDEARAALGGRLVGGASLAGLPRRAVTLKTVAVGYGEDSGASQTRPERRAVVRSCVGRRRRGRHGGARAADAVPLRARRQEVPDGSLSVIRFGAGYLGRMQVEGLYVSIEAPGKALCSTPRERWRERRRERPPARRRRARTSPSRQGSSSRAAQDRRRGAGPGARARPASRSPRQTVATGSGCSWRTTISRLSRERRRVPWRSARARATTSLSSRSSNSRATTRSSLRATTPEGGPQQLVGVARSDVDHVDAVLRDGTTVELPLNEWRAFSYTAPTSSQAAVGLVGRSTDGALGMVRVPQTTAVTQQAPLPAPTRSPTADASSRRGHRAASASLQGYSLQALSPRDAQRPRVLPRPGHTSLHVLGRRQGLAHRRDRRARLPQPRRHLPAPVRGRRIRRASAFDEAEILRAGGIAVDQAASVALLDRSGRQVALVPVVNNVYSFPGPFPKSAGFARVRARRSGNRLGPRLGYRHQTPGPASSARGLRRSIPPSSGTSSSAGRQRASPCRSGTTDGRVQRRRACCATRKALQADHIGFHCFQIGGQNCGTRGTCGPQRVATPVAFKVFGVPTPFDGCDIQGTYGHRWRDGRGTHSLVEVRSRSAGAATSPTARPRAISRSSSARARPASSARSPAGGSSRRSAAPTATGWSCCHAQTRCRRPASSAYTPAAAAPSSASERTGNRLYVVLEQGKIVDENVRGLAFVF